MNDPLDFSGKVVLVTGSSRGLGAEMIKAFGARGAQCVVNYVADAEDRNRLDAEAVARELKEPLVMECDVTNPSQVEAMMKTIGGKFGGLDILINNSGIIRDRSAADEHRDRCDEFGRLFFCHHRGCRRDQPM